MFENPGITIGSCYNLMRIPLEILKSLGDEDLIPEDENHSDKKHKSIPKNKGLSNLNLYFNVKIEEESCLASVYKDNEEEEKFVNLFDHEENSIEIIEKYYKDVSENNTLTQNLYIENNLILIKRLSLNELNCDLIHQKVFLPISRHLYTICIDLDETLIHADFKLELDDPDFIFEGKIEDKNGILPIFLRPGLSSFLERISNEFELILFTSSTKEYADIMLSLIDPQRKYFKTRLYRDNCIEKKGFLLKDLRVLTNRQLDKIILIDNNLINMSPQLNNSYLISSFYNDKSDNELNKLGDLLCQNSRNLERFLKKYTFEIN